MKESLTQEEIDALEELYRMQLLAEDDDESLRNVRLELGVRDATKREI